MKKVCSLAVLALLGLGVAAQAITIDTVTVGDPGNAADTCVMNDGTTGYGKVNYTYNIGKYEVTAGQYCAFLNAKAGVSDPYGLYNEKMWNGIYGCQIRRTSLSGGYIYSVASEYANRPVNYVSFWDACRFTNWLNNGQGNSDTETGVYIIANVYNDWAGQAIQRNANWKWAVTSEDEWYKAAYYKGGGAYSLYANGSNTAPVAGTSGSNYDQTIDRNWDGTINGALEQNGTKDMMGNVWEWNEAIVYQDWDYAYHSARGGSFYGNADYLQSVYRFDDGLCYPSIEYSNLAFRVVQAVPEPTYGISNRAAYHTIISSVSASVNFKVWGKVTIPVSGGSNSFTVDDGSGKPVTVVAPGFSGIKSGDYASAKGKFSGDGPGRVLNAQASDVVKLR